MLLETTRLVLRRLTPDDLDAVHRLDSDPKVMRYIVAPLSYEGARQYLQEILDNYEQFPGLGRWAVVEKTTGTFVGIHLLKPLEASGHVEVGYRFFPGFWGRGYATEMTRALLRYGFQELGLRQIVAITKPENFASQHVLEKCGFKYQRLAHFYGDEVRFYTIEGGNEPPCPS
ncbi:GNAT family N-acetyltransferase [Hymenobacter sp. B81]|uniref:GNAT family N-acetyltransferase n=1 Tax=Hymenobacter sp. B81 TaxID=3344878 RepID=UPI0037DD3531